MSNLPNLKNLKLKSICNSCILVISNLATPFEQDSNALTHFTRQNDIDSSFAGSPAEKADLEVADEILEVNGESLENSNHTDVIAHIHNVRSFCLYFLKLTIVLK